ncbi:hypothetical protein [Halorubrum depositum]|uniref:hypothetical protein n=1 Tax=Halorubrum depositum TaxID=2583992 RepID=UPI0011A1CAC6|nr:hypothetical protein [Halorubrum depositum]
MAPQSHTDDEVKRLLHNAIWNSLPDGKYREEMLEVEDINISESDGVYTEATVKNNLLDEVSSGWIESEVNGHTVQFKVGETLGLHESQVKLKF